MKSLLAVSLVLGLGALSGAPLLAQPGGSRRGERSASEFGWLSSLAEGKARSARSGKPLMVVLRCAP